MSRVELGKNKLPRFNMPFEAGIAYTVHAMQPQRRTHHMGVLDAKAYQYQASISDLAGLDPKIHNNDPAEAIACVREFLRRKSCRTDLPGAAHVQRRYLASRPPYPKVREPANAACPNSSPGATSTTCRTSWPAGSSRTRPDLGFSSW